jgi:hypothetical protein
LRARADRVTMRRRMGPLRKRQWRRASLIGALGVLALGCTSGSVQPTSVDAPVVSAAASALSPLDGVPEATANAERRPTAGSPVRPVAPPRGLRLGYELDREGLEREARGRCGAELVRALAVRLGLQPAQRTVLERATLTALHARVDLGSTSEAPDELRVTMHSAADEAPIDAAFATLVPSCELLERPHGTSPARWRGRKLGASELPRLGAEVANAMQRRVNELRMPVRVELEGPLVVARVAPLTEEDFASVTSALATRGKLEIRLVDDVSDPLPRLSGAVTRPWPVGIEADAAELMPAGPGEHAQSHYATGARQADEPLSVTSGRLRDWLAKLPVPFDHELALGSWAKMDEHGQEQILGWRSYYLHTWPELTAADVASAQAMVPEQGGPQVQVALTPAGALRFADLTADNVQRRVAIVLDGVVTSAPIVLGRIAGGHLVITLGTANPSAARDAEQLATVLRTGSLPAPVVLATEDRY